MTSVDLVAHFYLRPYGPRDGHLRNFTCLKCLEAPFVHRDDHEICQPCIGRARHRPHRQQTTLMDAFGNKWQQCTWCEWWGRVHDELERFSLDYVDKGNTVDLLLCERCTYLREPCWWPNNRQRCAASLKLSLSKKLPKEVLRGIADFLAGNFK